MRVDTIPDSQMCQTQSQRLWTRFRACVRCHHWLWGLIFLCAINRLAGERRTTQPAGGAGVKAPLARSTIYSLPEPCRVGPFSDFSDSIAPPSCQDPLHLCMYTLTSSWLREIPYGFARPGRFRVEDRWRNAKIRDRRRMDPVRGLPMAQSSPAARELLSRHFGKTHCRSTRFW